MKKIVLALIVLLFAAPAWADVDITAAQVGDTNEVIISFDNSGPNNVRAFGLNIQLDNDANILEVTGLHADYWVYPGTIQIDAAGDVQSYGSIAAEYGDLPSDTLEGPPDGNGVTLECASLYAPPGEGSPNEPDPFGPLASIKVSKDCTLCITANVSRAGATGVVMEDPDQVVTVNYPLVCLDVVIPEAGCTCLGEVNGDDKVNINDVIEIVGWINAYGTGRPLTIDITDTVNYELCGDANGDDKININDAIKIVGWINAYGTGRPQAVACPHSYP